MLLNPLLKNIKGADGAYTIVLMALLGIVTAMLIVLFLPKGCTTCVKEEGFENTTNAIDTSVFTCPNQSKIYIDMQGNSNCCKGEVNGKVCNGKILCTFSGNAMKQYPSCIRPPRKIRWRGTVSPWVKQWMNGEEYVQQFKTAVFPFLNYYPTNDMKQRLTQNDIDAWSTFIQEELTWFQTSQNEPLISYQEEIMLILEHFWALYQKSQTPVPSPLPTGNSASCTK